MADLFVLFDLNEPAPEDDDGNVGIDLNEPQDIVAGALTI